MNLQQEIMQLCKELVACAIRALDQAQRTSSNTFVCHYCGGQSGEHAEDCSREEVMPHSEPRAQTRGEHNTAAPVMGADPLDAAASQARMLWGGTIQFDELDEDEQDKWRDIVRVGIAFANAQRPSEKAIRMAEDHFLEKWPAAVALPTE